MKPTVALPLTTDRKAGQRGAREAAEARRGHAHLRRARRGRRPGARRRRSAPRASSCSPTGTTSAASRPSTPPSRSSRRRRSACSRSGSSRPDFIADDLETIADKTGGTYAAATSPGGAHEDLRRARLPARQRVPAPLPLRRRSPTRTSTSQVAVAGAEPVVVLVPEPVDAGPSAPYKPAFRDTLLQSWLLIPLVVALVLGAARLRPAVASGASARTRTLVARLGEFVTLPAEEQATRAPQGGRRCSSRPSASRSSDGATGAGSRGSPRTSTSRRSSTTRRRMIWSSVLAGLLLGVVAGVLVRPVLGRSSAIVPADRRSTSSSAARRARSGTTSREQLPENLDVLASALRAGHSLAGAMGVVADEAPEPSKREFTPRRHRRAARHPARRGARGDGEAHAEHRHRPGRRPRARPARGGRQHGGGARPGDHEHPRAHGHPPARHGADGAGQVLGGGRRRASRSGSSSS